MILGPTGSGKTTLARAKFGEPLAVCFNEELAALAHFQTLTEAQSSLAVVHLNLATALRPVRTLSGGERERLTLAWGLAEWVSGRRRTLIVDEFTSLLDRSLAKKVTASVMNFVRAHRKQPQQLQQQKQQLVLLTSHTDILGHGLLEPDWAFDCSRTRLLTFPCAQPKQPVPRPIRVRQKTAERDLCKRPRLHARTPAKKRWRQLARVQHLSPTCAGTMQEPDAAHAKALRLNIRPALPCEWRHFRDHHYKDHRLQGSAVCFVGELDGRAIAFTAIMQQGLSLKEMLSGNFDQKVIKEIGFPLKWTDWKLLREHRTVVLPDFQGLGVGSLMADAVASICEQLGYGFMSTTAHPTYGGYRDRSPLWATLPSSKRARPGGRALTFSHVWRGEATDDLHGDDSGRRVDLRHVSYCKGLAGT